MSGSLCVVMIIQQYHPRIGGAESQVATMASALRARDVEVHVFTRRYPNLAPFELVNQIPVHRLPIPGIKPTASLAFTLAALPLFRKLKPQVIHAHELFSPTTTAMAGKRLIGAPVVTTIHSANEIARLAKKFMGTPRLAEFRKNVDAFIVINREIEAELARVGIPPERRIFIPNGVDTARFTPLCARERRALRAAFGFGDAPVALYTGRLAPEKQLDRLIQIWNQVRAQIPGAQLALVGEGNAETTLKILAGDSVKFFGATNDVVPYLRAADLFVLPSAFEGFSVALLEALAVGLPALATAVGGNVEVIQHRANGWLVPAGDVNALRDALITLLGDADLRTQIGARARAHIVRHYDVASVAQKLCAVYERLATRKR